MNGLPFMRIFIGLIIAAGILLVADHYLTFGYYTERVLALLNHISREMGF